ncbi:MULTISPECIES: DUF5677 domain-containing protein [Pseudomonas]|uniref:DUF5677 domain-containing protein n=1 Tax=Pseudomonas TaxID=286 RepID=UPI001FE4A1E1|nr:MULTISPECIES: DUF5677 domain-containing protein [Pseudomonas]
MSTPSVLDELVKSLGTQASRLIISSEMEATGPTDPRDDFVRKQLRRTAELVSGAAVLGAAANPGCLGVLSRCLLEQLITVLWGIRSIENAESQSSAGTAQLAKAFKLNLEAGTMQVFDRSTGEDVTARYLEQERPKRRSPPSIQQQAKEADVADLYTAVYRFLSLETHGHSESPSEKSEIADLCGIHLQGIGAVSSAIGQGGVWWLVNRHWPDNESLREVLGLNQKNQ